MAEKGRKPGLFALENILNLLLIFIPISIVLFLIEAGAVFVFFSSALAIVPLAGLMGRATEALAVEFGEGIGGLLNATFGNAAELIIALAALRAGLHDVVKASITGSIIGNILLVFGLALLLGGLRYPKQNFNRTAATMSATLLTLAGIALVVPAIYHHIAVDPRRATTASPSLRFQEMELSTEIAVVLFITYVLSLIFALKTHPHLYTGGDAAEVHSAEGTHWTKRTAALVLLGATALVALMSEILVESIEHAADTLGMTDIFVGVILVAIIGNAAEHSTAVLVARKNKMDLAINIAIGSSLQIALFVAPVLVFASYLFGNPMDLRFTTFEVVAVVISAVVANLISSDGESNWMEGVQLLAVYLILGMAFYLLPA